jgi:phosphatidylserine/phosphatidylglycerophosphate/cardiolipin synthase-like enzyme
MPWRDEALFIVGQAARDVARHFIYRWNQCKVINYIENLKLIFLKRFIQSFQYEKPTKDHNIPYLLPKCYKDGIKYDFSWFKQKFKEEDTYNCNIQVFVLKLKLSKILKYSFFLDYKKYGKMVRRDEKYRKIHSKCNY